MNANNESERNIARRAGELDAPVGRALRECVICGEKVTESNATEEWEKRHEHTEPQGEPSDAQVLAALNAYYGGKHPVSDAFRHSMSPNMRAALHAAFAVAEQGENR
ncbi:hypothetical protein SEA_WATERT_111 [Microbacterium phage WaterT]|nr:hypothetical protein SEA_WATERT_111 [Microbacterium phage WaterT]